MDHKEWLNWQRQGIKVLYKNIDITDKIGLCICRDCIGTVKIDIDKSIDEGE